MLIGRRLVALIALLETLWSFNIVLISGKSFGEEKESVLLHKVRSKRHDGATLEKKKLNFPEPREGLKPGSNLSYPVDVSRNHSNISVASQESRTTRSTKTKPEGRFLQNFFAISSGPKEDQGRFYIHIELGMNTTDYGTGRFAFRKSFA